MTEEATEEQPWFSSWFDSPYYPILYKNRDDKEAEAFISHVISFLDPAKDAKIMDLACGRGRHSVFLAQSGWNVTGIDLSEESIAYARQLEVDRASFFVRDMREPFGLGSFDLILNLFTSFGYFDDPSENEKVLQHVFNALEPSGIFVLDFLNPKPVIANLVGSESRVEKGVQFYIEREVFMGKIIKDIKVLDGDQIYTFEERVQALTQDQIIQMAKQAGLHPFALWGDYAGNAFDESNSKRQIHFFRKDS